MNNFFKKVKTEWNRINWLKKEDVGKQTAVVVVTSLFLGVAISAIDLMGQWVVNLLTSIHF